jgi:type II secretory pathway pseudopilin PulG
VARSTATTSRPPRSRLCCRIPRGRGHAAAGYTLAESLIASVVLAIAIVAISGTLAASYQQNTMRGNTTSALNLAQQLMEEIAAKPIALPSNQVNKPGWQQGQTDRRLYDTVDDYNGYADFSSTIQAADGSTVNLNNGATSFQRSVTVQSGAVPAGLTASTPEDFVLVTVTVNMPYNQNVSVSQLVTRVTRLR